MAANENIVKPYVGQRLSTTFSYNTSTRQSSTSSTYASPNRMLETVIRSGNDTPGWTIDRTKMPSPVKSTAYSLTKRRDYYWVGNRNTTYYGNSPWTTQYQDVGVLQNSLQYDVLPTAALEARVQSLAVTKFLSSVKNQKVNLWQVYAEREQTIRLVGEAATRLVKALAAIKRGNLTQAARELGVKVSRRQRSEIRRKVSIDPTRAVATQWLALQYGWLPFLSDVHGAAEAIFDANNGPPVGKASARAALTTSDQLLVDSSSINGMKFAINRKVRVIVKYSGFFTVTNDPLHSLASMGITNPLTIAWELTPWSFVVDWFLPIGNWINSLDATVGVNFLHGTRTVVAIHECDGTIASYNPAGLYRASYASGTSHVRMVNVRRSPLTSWPSPALPSFKSPASVAHALNAIALLRTTFGR